MLKIPDLFITSCVPPRLRSFWVWEKRWHPLVLEKSVAQCRWYSFIHSFIHSFNSAQFLGALRWLLVSRYCTCIMDLEYISGPIINQPSIQPTMALPVLTQQWIIRNEVWLLLVSEPLSRYRSTRGTVSSLSSRRRSPEGPWIASFSKTPTTSFFHWFHGTQGKAKDDVFASFRRKLEAY